MVCVYKTGDVNMESLWFWHMWWQFIIGPEVEVCPIPNVEASVINVWICWVKY